MNRQLEELAQKHPQRVFAAMKASRGVTFDRKYRLFILGMGILPYVTNNPEKARLIKPYYSVHREPDDIVDGDLPLPKRYSNVREYIRARIDAVRNDSPVEDSDYVLQYCLIKGKKFGVEQTLRESSLNILQSIEWDAERSINRRVPSLVELTENFYRLDIIGTGKPTLALLGEDVEKYRELAPLGTGSRITYILEDWQQDARSGRFNISQEECQQFGINLNDLENTPRLRPWFESKKQEASELLIQHKAMLERVHFNAAMRMAMHYGHFKPAITYLGSK